MPSAAYSGGRSNLGGRRKVPRLSSVSQPRVFLRSSGLCLGPRSEKVGERHSKRLGQPFREEHRGVAAGVFDLAYLSLVNPDRPGQRGLGQAERLPPVADVLRKHLKRRRGADRKPGRKGLRVLLPLLRQRNAPSCRFARTNIPLDRFRRRVLVDDSGAGRPACSDVSPRPRNPEARLSERK